MQDLLQNEIENKLKVITLKDNKVITERMQKAKE